MKALIACCLILILIGCQPVDNTGVTVNRGSDSIIEAYKKAIGNDTAKPAEEGETMDSLYDVIVVEGEKGVDKYVTSVRYKFMPFVGFQNYAVEIYKGGKAAINYKSHPLGRTYKTAITCGYNFDNLVDFGGHYKIASWGCGSNCQSTVLVDMQSGNIYEGPITANRFNVKPDSRLFIANPPDSTGYIVAAASTMPQLYIWDEGKKKFEELTIGGKLVPMVNFR